MNYSKVEMKKEIDIRYKIDLSGQYNPGLTRCPDCDWSIWDGDGSVYNECCGIAETTVGTYMVIECPKCFTHYYFHIRLVQENGHYEYFLKCVERCCNKHFPKI